MANHHKPQHPHLLPSPNRARFLRRAGHEKVIRIFNLERPDAEALAMPAATSAIRTINFIQNDTMIVCSYSDEPGLG